MTVNGRFSMSDGITARRPGPRRYSRAARRSLPARIEVANGSRRNRPVPASRAGSADRAAPPASLPRNVTCTWPCDRRFLRRQLLQASQNRTSPLRLRAGPKNTTSRTGSEIISPVAVCMGVVQVRLDEGSRGKFPVPVALLQPQQPIDSGSRRRRPTRDSVAPESRPRGRRSSPSNSSLPCLCQVVGLCVPRTKVVAG